MSDSAEMSGPLAGRRILVTRERPGELGRLLAERGAEVVHVPLIATTDPPDHGDALKSALDRLDEQDWLIVTSAAGAERVGAALRHHPDVALATVGTATARVLSELVGRPVDLVPDRQVAVELAAALNDRLGHRPARMLIAQADRAPSTLADLLAGAGHSVTAVTAYSTVSVAPDATRLDGIDALVLASGSAATSWVEAFGANTAAMTPPVVVAIGPTTADVARQVRLKVTAIAAEYSLVGLVDTIVQELTDSPR